MKTSVIEFALVAATLQVDEGEVDQMRREEQWKALPRHEVGYYQRVRAAKRLLMICEKELEEHESTKR